MAPFNTENISMQHHTRKPIWVWQNAFPESHLLQWQLSLALFVPMVIDHNIAIFSKGWSGFCFSINLIRIHLRYGTICLVRWCVTLFRPVTCDAVVIPPRAVWAPSMESVTPPPWPRQSARAWLWQVQSANQMTFTRRQTRSLRQHNGGTRRPDPRTLDG